MEWAIALGSGALLGGLIGGLWALITETSNKRGNGKVNDSERTVSDYVDAFSFAYREYRDSGPYAFVPSPLTYRTASPVMQALKLIGEEIGMDVWKLRAPERAAESEKQAANAKAVRAKTYADILATSLRPEDV